MSAFKSRLANSTSACAKTNCMAASHLAIAMCVDRSRQQWWHVSSLKVMKHLSEIPYRHCKQ